MTGLNIQIPEKYRSRKFIIAVAGLVAIITGVPEDALAQIIPVLLTYLGGQSVVDAAAAYKGSKKE